MPRVIRASLVLFLFAALPALGISTKSVADGLTAQDVAGLLAGPGVLISNVKITGANTAIGSFESGGIGIDQGVILSSGLISDAVGPNTASGKGAALGAAGHPALDAIVAPFSTFDATVIEFDVVTESPTFAIRYIFASEEYREYVDSEYNDVFAFFVNGANIALTPGTSAPVTINTINHLRNQGLYRDNEGGNLTEYDGYTVPLTAVGIVEPGVPQRIRIAIADTSDSILDSAVLIAQGGISGSQLAPIPIPSRSEIAASYGTPEEVSVALYYATPGFQPHLSAYGIEDATFTFLPITSDENNLQSSILRIELGPASPAGSHLVTIRSAAGEAEAFATILVIVDCKPPSLLGIGQPLTQTVARGTPATFRVQPEGSGPFSYQWYRGYAGMTGAPVSGGTGSQYVTPAVNEMTAYWVRIRNVCGSHDSLTAFAVPQ